jgi:predicted ATPase
LSSFPAYLTLTASQELTFQLGLGAVLFATEGFSSADAGRAFQRSRELCRKLGDETQLPAAAHGPSVFFFGGGQYLKARDAAQELVAIAERAQVSEVLFTAHFSIGNALNAVGDVLSARDEFEHALRVFEGSVGLSAKLETEDFAVV